MSKRARDRVDKTIGLYLDPDICRNRSLTLAERLVLAQVRQMDAKKVSGRVTVSNDFLSEACGLSLGTVKHAIPSLVLKGHLGVENCGYRRLKVDTESAKSAPEITARQSAKAAPTGADTALVSANSGHASANLAPPSEGRRDVMNNMTDMKAAAPPESESVLFLENQDPVPEQASVLRRKTAVAHASNLQDTFSIWAEQTCSLIHARPWDKPQPGGKKAPVRLGIPVPGTASGSELASISGIAAAKWQGSEPAMAMRQALRAAAWTLESRERLQQRACAFGDSRISARTILTIGGKDDPTAFLRERCEAVPPPPAKVPSCPATAADADALIALCGVKGRRWIEPGWRQSWLEAAARAKDLGYMPCGNLEFYAFCALDKADRFPDDVPFPWLVDSITVDDIAAFMPEYLADRKNAWCGGPSRRRRDPAFIPPPYDRCVGRLMANAAAIVIEVERGMVGFDIASSGFRSRRCLLCAARDLEFDPDLVKYVKPWKGTGLELAKAMRELAERTPDDEAPNRGLSCGPGRDGGRGDMYLPSWIRCPHGDAQGTYDPASSDVFNKRERKPPNLT